MHPSEQERQQMRNTYIYSTAMLGKVTEYVQCALLSFIPQMKARMLAVVEEMQELKEKPETLFFSGRTIKDE